MNTLLASYVTPSGATVRLHYGGRFWTERKDDGGTTLIAVDDARRAHEHYEYAQEHGETVNTFPLRFRARALVMGS